MTRKYFLGTILAPWRDGRRCLFVFMLGIIIFLSGCGKGGSSDEEPTLPKLPVVLSVTPVADSLAIDLNKTQSISFDVITRFDDESEKTDTFIATWDSEKGELQITDSNNSLVVFDYDSDALKVEATLVTITDAQLPENVAITLSLTPLKIDDVKISVLLPQAVSSSSSSTGFYVNDVVQLDVKALNITGDVIENALSFVSCSIEENVVLKVSSDCVLTALDLGEANVTVTLNSDVNVSATIKINVLPRVIEEPTIIEIIPQPLSTALYLGDQNIQLNVKAKKSDDLIIDALSQVTCSVISNAVAAISSDCLLTTIDTGEVNVLVSLTSNENINASIKIEILPVPVYVTEILPQPLSVALYEGDKDIQLGVNVKMSDGSIVDGLSDVVCSVESNLVTTISTDCLLTAAGQGNKSILVTLKNNDTISASIKITVLPLYVTDLIVTHSTPQLWTESSQTFKLSAKFNNGVEIEDARDIAKCTSSPADTTIISVAENCVVTAGLEVGSADVSAELKNAQTQSINISAFALNVATPPDVLSVPITVPSGEFMFQHTFNPAFGTYKVRLVAPPNVFLDTNMKIWLGTVANPACYNFPGYDKSTVACGIDTTGTTGEILVTLYDPPEGFTGSLELILDDDILVNDNQGAEIPASIDDYKLLLTDSSPVDGHVSSNATSLNVSRYRTDPDNGLLLASPGHKVTVKFKPDIDGNTHFDEDNVKISWAFDNAKSLPVVDCTPLTCSCNKLGDSLVCDVFESHEDLFVFVYGNGPDLTSLSPSTADGELSYSVEIINK
ncbi:MAG: hypothetical protein OEX07_03375 [Gammaproteobacteria bacterium]|nr:hypothetical protein [Gammaproteobacteria bacterium]